MQFNFLKNQLLLLIFVLFIYSYNVLAQNIFKSKTNINLNNQKFVYIEDNLNKKYQKECMLFFRKNKKYLVTIGKFNYIGNLTNNTFNIYYLVKRNDTLYSISKRLHYNFSKLIKCNNFYKPYKILIGQKILVNAISIFNKNKINYIVYKNQCKSYILHNHFLNNKINVLNFLKQNKSFFKICFIYNKNESQINNIVKKENILCKRWVWPLKNYQMNFIYNNAINNQGIEINGIEGQSIFASSRGRVVYVGDLFKNYGKLIIIQHDHNYLSIYGFNRNIFVKLNDQVNQNQKISTMGCSNNNIAKLYFSILFKGNSINLLNLFPNISLKKY